MRLSASDLAVIRGTKVVVANINFSLSQGEALLVLGPNGAGKSSLLRAVAGLLRPAAGAIGLEGGAPERTIGEQAHYLGHQDAFKPTLTVAENLQFWIRYLRAEEGLGLARALDAVGLALLADLPAGYLSAGQKRRLSIARLLAVRRPIWLLDEPSSALDAAGQHRLAELLGEHLANGLIIAASHTPLLAKAQELQLGPREAGERNRAPAWAAPR